MSVTIEDDVLPSNLFSVGVLQKALYLILQTRLCMGTFGATRYLTRLRLHVGALAVVSIGWRCTTSFRRG